MREVDGEVPAHLREWWAQDQPWCLHSAGWWRKHWGRTGIVEVEVADAQPDGWQRWLDWLKMIAPDNAVEIAALEADRGAYLGYVRAVGRRTAFPVYDQNPSIPAQYTKHPLLRSA